MGNASVKILIDTRHYDASVTLKRVDHLADAFDDPHLSNYLEKVIRAKINDALIEFNVLAGLVRANKRDLIGGFEMLVGQLHDDRMRKMREYGDQVLGSFDEI